MTMTMFTQKLEKQLFSLQYNTVTKYSLFSNVSKWSTIKPLVCVQCGLHHMLLNVGQHSCSAGNYDVFSTFPSCAKTKMKLSCKETFLLQVI